MASTAKSQVTSVRSRHPRPGSLPTSLPFRTRQYGYQQFPNSNESDSDSGGESASRPGSLVAVRAEGGRLVPEDPKVAEAIVSNPAGTPGSSELEASLDLTDDQQPTVVIFSEEGPVEARHVSNNYLFGQKKWKGRVIERPLEERSEAVKSLYGGSVQPDASRNSSLKPGNVLYFFLFGWWSALIYFFVAGLMALTICGWPMAIRCGQLALYMAWPFGKFVHTTSKAAHEHDQQSLISQTNAAFSYESTSAGLSVRQIGESADSSRNPSPREDQLAESTNDRLSESWVAVNRSSGVPKTSSGTGNAAADRSPRVFVSSGRSHGAGRQRSPTSQQSRLQPSFIVWLVLGAPIVLPMHLLITALSWFFVVLIPVAKFNVILIRRVLFQPPKSVCITSSNTAPDFFSRQSEVRLCVYEAVNLYYYKYSVDGMNVVLVNLLPFVVLSLLNGYLDEDNSFTSNTTKFSTSLVAIIPLAYYIGLAITSIAAQSTYAVGAVLNATFGSIVELTLYVTLLLKAHGKPENSTCYDAIVKASLTGTLLATMLFIPGICMIIGGLKHREQRFNWRSAGVSSSLLFVSVAGSYSPTLFAKAYGGEYETMHCMNCTSTNEVLFGHNESNVSTTGFNCTECSMTQQSGYILVGPQVRKLSYVCAALLPLTYILGLLFTLKTHRYIYEEPVHSTDDKFAAKSKSSGHHGHGAQWSRLKGMIILLIATVLMSLLAEQVSKHIQPVLNNSGISPEFIGITILAIVPDIPEIVNGIQFAMQNNISLSIEVGSSIAVQVCLLQIPVLVWVDALYGIGFHLVFNDTQLWTVIFGVLVMNYIFMDGKSDYFQGVILVTVYIILVIIFFFIPASSQTAC